MKLKSKKYLHKFSGWIFAFVFVILTAALAIGALRSRQDARFFCAPAEALSGFAYEIANGANGTAAFPHHFENLPPNTAITVYTDIEPGQYDSLLVKTVYSGLRLYADDTLIYESGQPGSYPAWLLDPPTLLKIVPLPKTASALRFEYISPTQRSTMSAPSPMAGSDGALLAWMFGSNAALLIISFLMLFIGIVVTVLSFCYWRLQEAGRPFFYLGLFAFAAGCWGLGECNATAFIIPYPTLLYFMAIGGLAAFIIPLLSYGIAVLRPKNPLPMRIMRDILRLTLIVVFALQLFGVKALSNTLFAVQILDIIGILVFAATAFWEHFRNKNKAARWFALPSLVLLAASLLEYVNYSMRFTSILSLFLMIGILIFTFMLGLVGMRNARELMKKAETARKAAKKLEFYHTMSHDILTPLTRVSTNVQMAGYAPETAKERLSEAQADIMLIADMVNKALSDGGEGDKP